MQKLMFSRKENKIVTHSDTGDSLEVFKSVNAAKHQSRLLQQANGGLGRGSLRVIR